MSVFFKSISHKSISKTLSMELILNISSQSFLQPCFKIRKWWHFFSDQSLHILNHIFKISSPSPFDNQCVYSSAITPFHVNTSAILHLPSTGIPCSDRHIYVKWISFPFNYFRDFFFLANIHPRAFTIILELSLYLFPGLAPCFLNFFPGLLLTFQWSSFSRRFLKGIHRI